MPGVMALDMVRDVVGAHRRQGVKIDAAFKDAGVILNVSPRWIRSVIRGEPAAIKPIRARAIYAGFTAWLKADTERLEQQIANRRAMLKAMETEHVMAMDGGENAEFLVGVSASAEAST